MVCVAGVIGLVGFLCVLPSRFRCDVPAQVLNFRRKLRLVDFVHVLRLLNGLDNEPVISPWHCFHYFSSLLLSIGFPFFQYDVPILYHNIHVAFVL